MREISTAEITRMRSLALAALPDLATIKRPSTVENEFGGRTNVPVTVASDVKCRVDPPGTPMMTLYGDRITGRQAVQLAFSALLDVRAGDQAIIGGVTYEILGELTGSWEIVRDMAAVRL